MQVFIFLNFSIALAEDIDLDSEAGSQTYSTPHGELQLPSSMAEPRDGAESRVEEEQLNSDPLPQSKRQRVMITENEQ